jgi:hypothetical protein
MTDQHTWRPIAFEEASVIRAIVAATGIRYGAMLLDDLDGALVSNSTPWILDVKVSNTNKGCDLPDGPFPARAFVPNSAAYQGEVIIWLSNGHLSGLEYAWITEEPPTRWPQPGEMQVLPQTNG